jgi:hypothetical protein
MRFIVRGTVVVFSVVLLLAVGTLAGPRGEDARSFEGIEVIRIGTISGDCIIQKGGSDKVEVEVVWSYRPRGSFEPEFRERGKVLRLGEDMYGSNSGYSTWTLSIPDGIEVRFHSASGGLEIEGLSGEFSCETASGDIQITNCTGEFDLNTASGDIELFECEGDFRAICASGDVEVNGCSGGFEVSTASGSVRADGITLGDASAFSTASGRVIVELAKSSEHDLFISSASGRATLDYGGNELKGYFELACKYRGGNIVASVDFDDEERYQRWGDRYVRKWFTKGSDSPQISIETASGKAVLR